MKIKIKEKKGFTLIEFLIYGAIVSLLIGSLVVIGVNVSEGRARIEVMENINYDAGVAFSRITYYIRRAEGVNNLNPGEEADELSLEMSSSDMNPTIFAVNEEGGLTFKVGDNDSARLTGSNIEVTSLIFTNLSGGKNKETVRVEMSLKYKNPLGREDYNFEETFYITETIKK